MLTAELPESHCRPDLMRTLLPLALEEHSPYLQPTPLRLIFPQEVTLYPLLTLKARCLCHHPAAGSE